MNPQQYLNPGNTLQSRHQGAKWENKYTQNYINHNNRTTTQQKIEDISKEGHKEEILLRLILQGYHTAIKAKNRFITDDRRYWKGRTQEQTGRESMAFDPQQFQPMIKGNNRCFAEEGRNYERSPAYA